MDLNRAEQAIRTSQARTKQKNVCMKQNLVGILQMVLNGYSILTMIRDRVQIGEQMLNQLDENGQYHLKLKINQVKQQIKNSKYYCISRYWNGKFARMAYYDALKRYGEEHIMGATTSEDAVVSAQKNRI